MQVPPVSALMQGAHPLLMTYFVEKGKGLSEVQTINQRH